MKTLSLILYSCLISNSLLVAMENDKPVPPQALPAAAESPNLPPLPQPSAAAKNPGIEVELKQQQRIKEDLDRLKNTQANLVDEYTRKSYFYGVGSGLTAAVLGRVAYNWLSHYFSFSLNPWVSRVGVYGAALATGYAVGKNQITKSKKVHDCKWTLVEYADSKEELLKGFTAGTDEKFRQTELEKHAREYILRKAGLGEKSGNARIPRYKK